MADAAGVDVRRAARSDVDALRGLWAAFVAEQAAFDARLTPAPDADRLWAATLREALDSGTPSVLVADVDGRVAGFVVIDGLAASPVLAAPPSAVVGELYVAPSFRRRGLARALLDAASAEAARLGAAAVRFEVASGNAASHALVAAWGARPLATVYTREFDAPEPGPSSRVRPE